MPQSEATAQLHLLQDVPLFDPCTHLGGVTSPGGFVPQPLDAVVKENSDGSAEQQVSWKQQAEPGVATVPPIAVQADSLLTALHWLGGIWQVTPLVPHAVAAKQEFSSFWHLFEIDLSCLLAQLWNTPLPPELVQGQFDRTALSTLQRRALHAAVRPPKSPARADAPGQMASKKGSRIAGSRK
ncbi:MAG: hypothetical protein E6J59_18640 [Deltaproteobacteria bacterium]|nr:MAG: hypothetical protein E6J59_18640 [Deltaproteobacteria bacterium]